MKSRRTGWLQSPIFQLCGQIENDIMDSMLSPLPPYVISILFYVGFCLCVYSAWRHKEWTGKLFAPPLFIFASIYLFYNLQEVDIFIRQIQVRFALAILALVVILWRITVIWLYTRGNGNK